VSRSKTPHQKREASRSRRALDRAILRAVRGMSWSTFNQSERVVIDRDNTMELIGLCLARRRLS